MWESTAVPATVRFLTLLRGLLSFSLHHQKIARTENGRHCCGADSTVLDRGCFTMSGPAYC